MIIRRIEEITLTGFPGMECSWSSYVFTTHKFDTGICNRPGIYRSKCSYNKYTVID